MDCIRCKGRVDSEFACGRDFCPVYTRSEAMFKSVDSLKSDFVGSSPSVFVGRYGYPDVNVGILSPGEIKSDAWLYDAPSHWANKSFEIKKVVQLRSSLINSRFKANIKKPVKPLGFAQEIAMASKPVNVDISLVKKPSAKLSFSGVSLPMGPTASLEKVDLASNPKIARKVDKVVSDTDLKSVGAMKYLYDSGFGENELTKILSVGVLGLKKNRRLVPTRWSITATDDTLGKLGISEIKKYPFSDYLLFQGSLYGNYYFVLMFPEVWGYELFEGYLPRSLWNQSSSIEFATDHEFFTGRKGYAVNTAGGYYAARLPIIEKLRSMRRQSSVVVLRFISDEYSCPLGVFVCREAVRKAMASRPFSFQSQNELLDYTKNLVSKMFNYDVSGLYNDSLLLKNMRSQTKLSAFF